jgi:hypothetical protein
VGIKGKESRRKAVLSRIEVEGNLAKGGAEGKDQGVGASEQHEIRQ